MTSTAATAYGAGRDVTERAARGHSPPAPAGRTRIRRPSRRSNAGNNVTAAAIVRSTETVAATAIPSRNASPTVNMPDRDTHTVTPAKTTLRHDVAAAAARACSAARPSWIPCR